MQMPARMQRELPLADTEVAGIDISNNGIDQTGLESYLKNRNAIITENSAALMGSSYQKRIQAITDGDARPVYPRDLEPDLFSGILKYQQSTVTPNVPQTGPSSEAFLQKSSLATDAKAIALCEAEVTDLTQAVDTFCNQNLSKANLLKLENFFDVADQLEMKLESMLEAKHQSLERVRELLLQVNKVVDKVEQAADSIDH